jgi:energy-coupling factor transporter transmembrane protein EcfT
LIGILIFPLFIKDFNLDIKSIDKWEKNLKLNLLLTFVFLILLCFRGAVESNWILVALFPIIYFGYKSLEKRFYSSGSKNIVLLISISIFLNLVVKFYIVFDFIPNYFSAKTEFFGWEIWAKQLAKRTGDFPFVFVNSYQKAAKYHFYSGKISYSYTNLFNRRSQYDFDKSENYGLNDSIIFSPNWQIFCETGHIPPKSGFYCGFFMSPSIFDDSPPFWRFLGKSDFLAHFGLKMASKWLFLGQKSRFSRNWRIFATRGIYPRNRGFIVVFLCLRPFLMIPHHFGDFWEKVITRFYAILLTKKKNFF